MLGVPKNFIDFSLNEKDTAPSVVAIGNLQCDAGSSALRCCDALRGVRVVVREAVLKREGVYAYTCASLRCRAKPFYVKHLYPKLKELWL